MRPVFKDIEFRLTSGSEELEQKARNYEDFWIRSIGPTLYNKFTRDYTQKMWLIADNSIIDDFSWSPKGVAIKRGPRAGWDTAISAYPTHYDGYNKIFDSAQELCDIHIVGLVESILEGSLKAKISGEIYDFDIIINTAPLDDLLKVELPKLRYIGRRLEYIVLPVEYALPPEVYFSYYTGAELYTRVVEYKKFTRYKSPNTLISLEYPDESVGRYYPLPVAEQRSLHSRYLTACHKDMYNVGRLALYNYRYDIDDVIEQVIQVCKSLAE